MAVRQSTRYRPAPHGAGLQPMPEEQMRMVVRLAGLRLQGEQRALDAERNSDTGPKTLLEYAERYRRIDQQPFSLENYEPLRALYADTSPTMVVIKPSQRGASEWAITKVLFVLDRAAKVFGLPKSGLNVGYIFPTDVALRDFSKERVTGIKDEHEHLRRLLSTSPYDGIGFKQIGSSYLYMRGGASEAGLLSFSADMIVRDEYDKIPQASRELAEKRMNASLFKWLVDISTPTLPGMGIHARFMASDQHIYLQTCPNCKQESQYDFFRDVTVEGTRYDVWEHMGEQQIRRSDVALTCPRCEFELDKAARCAPGRYEAQYPDVQGLRGYHIPALAFPFVNLMELAVKAVNPDPSAKEQFMRQDLGQPYHSKGSGITEEDLVPLALGLPNGQLPPGPYTRVTAGIDVGGRIHVRINGRKPGERKPYVLLMTSVTTWEEVDNLMLTYNVQMAVVDAYPEMHAASAFVSRHKGRAVIGDYPTNMGALKGNLFAPDSRKAVQDGYVRINRTMALDRVMTAILTQSEHWPTKFVNDPEVRGHMTGMARLTAIDTRGQVVASWTRLRADHFFHACLRRDALVKTEYGELPIEDVHAGMRVWTRSGLRRVMAAGMTSMDAPVYECRFSDGSTLTGTGNHPVHTDRGWVRLDALTYSDIISTWQDQRASPTKESCSGGIQTVRAERIASTTRRTGRTASAGLADCMKRSIGTYTARYRPVISCTTKTRIAQTTTRTTLSQFLRASTWGDTQRSVRVPSTCERFSRFLMPGGRRRKAKSGTASMRLMSILDIMSRDSSRVLSAGQRLKVAPRRVRAIDATVRAPVTRKRAGNQALMMRIVRALSAVRCSESTVTRRREPALKPAKENSSVRLSERKAAGVSAVYNLSVEETEEYFANNILVHNSAYAEIAAELTPKIVRPTRIIQGAAKTQMPSGTNYRPPSNPR